MTDPPELLTAMHIYFRVQPIANRNQQSEKVKQHAICEGAMSAPNDNYRSGCIVFEVRPYGLAVGFPV